MFGLLTDAIAAIAAIFDATKAQPATSTIVLRDTLVAMRFHFLERPREIGDARALRWRDFAIEHHAHAEQVADDLHKMVNG